MKMCKLQQLLVARLKAAQRLLSRPQHASDATIHTARQDLKLCRAILRLLRSAMSNSAYWQANIELRDINRMLRESRDIAVALETLTSIRKRQPTLKVAIAALQRHWRRERGLDRHSAAVSASIKAAHKELALATAIISRQQLRPEDKRDPLTVLLASYRKARHAYRSAIRRESDSAWHECRKQTKYLYYQLQVLTPVGLESNHLTKEVHTLSDRLGNHRDLLLLRARIGAGGDRALISYIDQRRARLLRRAVVSASRLYRRRPRALADRLRLESKQS
jgi:NADH dehydrogenase/NADH:ubiquinone oxidoreductase subunit G